MSKKQKKMLIRIIVALVVFIACEITEKLIHLNGVWDTVVKAAMFAVPYLMAGYDVLLKAIKNISKGHVFDENFLMAVATVGAYGTGEFGEAAAVMLFYQVGEWFQKYAVNRSRASITDLMNIIPEYANIEKDGQIVQVEPETVAIGDIIIVQPGEKVPLDGTVIEGETFVDTAALTGESVPRKLSVGDEVLSGVINQNGVIRVKVSKEFDDSTVSKILELVENASTRKAQYEQFITRFAKYYTPIVCFLALAVAIIPPIFVGEFGKWFHRALIFLVVSCPCALVISIPLSFFSGIGGASKAGILVKGSNYLELLGKAKIAVFDKTGTLTKAKPTVVDVVSFDNNNPDEMLRIAACMEEHFPHSMAKAVVSAARKKHLAHEEMHSKVEYVVAHGISTTIEEHKAVIGSYHFVFEDEKCVIPEDGQEKFDSIPEEYSHLYLAIDGRLAAVICIEDPLREEAKASVEALRAAGISKIVMMTGDSERTAAAIARRVGVDEYYSEVLPEDKANFIEKEKAAGRRVIMVGDGINDSPALSAANVGIAISDGAEIAREIADITVGADDLQELVVLKEISNALMKRIRRNYRFIITFNAGLIACGVAGILQPTTSALLHNTSTLAISLKSMQNLLP